MNQITALLVHVLAIIVITIAVVLLANFLCIILLFSSIANTRHCA